MSDSNDADDAAGSTLERGAVWFFYRPRVEEEQPEGQEDIQDFLMVLHPDDGGYRSAIVGRKAMPDPERAGKGRYWGFVATVADDPEQVVETLEAESYGTATRGERYQPASRPAGRGVYRLVRHRDHVHFVYALSLPESPDEVQEELNLEEEASYILAIKNPNTPSPPGAGLQPAARADYPEKLQGVFGDLRFVPADPPELLDYEGAELVLISAASEVDDELGVELEPEDDEWAFSSQLFEELELERSERRIEPLTEGSWQ